MFAAMGAQTRRASPARRFGRAVLTGAAIGAAGFVGYRYGGPTVGAALKKAMPLARQAYKRASRVVRPVKAGSFDDFMDSMGRMLDRKGKEHAAKIAASKGTIRVKIKGAVRAVHAAVQQVVGSTKYRLGRTPVQVKLSNARARYAARTARSAASRLPKKVSLKARIHKGVAVHFLGLKPQVYDALQTLKKHF